MQSSPNAMFQFIPLIFIFGVFYFLIIRPQIKKQKDHQLMINNLNKNDEVVTAGGMHGTIINLKDKTAVIRVDDNTKIEVEKSAIGYVKKQRI